MKRRNYLRIYMQLFKISSPWYVLIMCALLLSFLLTYANISMADYSKKAVDFAVGKDMNKFTRELALFIFFFFLSIIIDSAQQYILDLFNARSANKIRTKMMESYLTSKYKEISKYRTGDIENRILNEATNAPGVLSHITIGYITNVIIAIGSFIYLYRMNTILALISLGVGPLLLTVGTIFGSRMRKIINERMQAESEALSDTQEALANYNFIKAYNVQRDIVNRVRYRWQRLFDFQFKIELINRYNVLSSAWIKDLSKIALYGIGGYYIYKKSMTPGTLIAFIQLSSNMISPFLQMSYMLTSLVMAMASAERVFEIIGLEKETGIVQKASYKDVKEKQNEYIWFCGVDFKYDKDMVLNDLSFSIQKGEKVCIVGESGIGKSTIFRLLMRFYDPCEGVILLQGKDIREYNVDELRSKIAYVHQDTVLFTGTIRDNIVLGKEDATEDEIYEAVKAAGLYEFISSLPEGLDTRVSERGSSLSGGQKQRISIARALLKDAPIILLDEALSALDAETEKHILISLKNLYKEKTIILITHRLSTTAYADRVLVVDDGKIAEQGNFEELLGKQGTFYKLYNSKVKTENANREAAVFR
ncbi:ATP-binding cassette, subfamily B, MsbA [Caldanaerobius fijiensis DSM 17918]|uniref:ATP-binding cassette, subfamily B, MsbA n=1 Tax=Caldanaerobius fijiensis DSM 17918 TaxID=1121256 RepID=A0A1M4VFF8_9THEO|nr:ABC transporter ATP-binding protein [Caldanaerobius fijiensis]SHE67699.1 ATP-binding cassette, subfamily B, MsbA [Caldanaerobius fijiensis DSM 17918]